MGGTDRSGIDRQTGREHIHRQVKERQTGRWRTDEQVRTVRQEEDRQTGRGQRQTGRGQTTGEGQTSRCTNRWMNRQIDR